MPLRNAPQPHAPWAWLITGRYVKQIRLFIGLVALVLLVGPELQAAGLRDCPTAVAKLDPQVKPYCTFISEINHKTKEINRNAKTPLPPHAVNGFTWRRARYVHRWYRSQPVAVFEPNGYYDPLLPSTLDTAYDRAMVLHFRSPAVTDTYLADAVPPTPPVHGIFPYRVRAWDGVYNYDGLIGEYVRLAPTDAALVTAPDPALAP